MIKIRKLTSEMVSDFVLLHLKCWEETYFGIFPPEVMESRYLKENDRKTHVLKRLNDPDYFYFSIYDEEKMIGIFIFSILDEEALLDAIYIMKEYQKKGYGTKILDFVETVLKKQKINKYYVYVFKSLASQKFFIKRGAKLMEESLITIHGADYSEIGYEMEVLKS